MEQALRDVRNVVKHNHTTTHHGIEFDVLKSALQKSIRRGEVQEARRYALEGWGLVAVDSPVAKGQVTNLINRLTLIMSEDVGIGSPYLPHLLEKRIEYLLAPANRRTAKAVAHLLEIVSCLAGSPHSRMASLVNTAYFDPAKRQAVRRHAPTLYRLRVPSPLDGLRCCLAGDKSTDDGSLCDDSYEATAYAGMLAQSQAPMQCPQVKEELGLTRTIGVHAVWEEVLDALILSGAHERLQCVKSLLALLRIWKRRKGAEDHCYLLHALLMCIHEYRGYPDGSQLKPSVTSISIPDATAAFIDHFATPMTAVPQAYKDMHTRAGGRLGFKKGTLKGHRQFVEEGTLLANSVDDKQELQELYAAVKLDPLLLKVTNSVGPSRKRARGETPLPMVHFGRFEWNELSDVKPTQVRACGGKPMTFSARHGGRDVIFKKATFSEKPGVVQGAHVQLLADGLKPLFGLRRMGAAVRKANFDTRRLDPQQDWVNGNWEHFESPDTLYLYMPRAQGTPLASVEGWKTDRGLMLRYLEIGIFRYATWRFSDFNPRNVMLLEDGQLLSIDEMGTGRTSAFGAKPPGYLVGMAQSLRSELQSTLGRWRQIPMSAIMEVTARYGFDDGVAREIHHNLRDPSLLL